MFADNISVVITFLSEGDTSPLGYSEVVDVYISPLRRQGGVQADLRGEFLHVTLPQGEGDLPHAPHLYLPALWRRGRRRTHH